MIVTVHKYDCKKTSFILVTKIYRAGGGDNIISYSKINKQIRLKQMYK